MEMVAKMERQRHSEGTGIMIIIGCIILFDVCHFLFTVSHIAYLRIIQIICVGFFIFFSFRLAFFGKPFGQKKKIIFLIFAIWSGFIVLRINDFNIDELRLVLFQPIHALAYIIPVIALCLINSNFAKVIFFPLPFLWGIFFIFFLFLPPAINATDQFTAIFAPIVYIGCLTWRYHFVRTKLLITSLLLAIFYLAILNARRTVLFTGLCVVNFGILLFIFRNEGNKILRLYAFISFAIAIFLLSPTLIRSFSWIDTTLFTERLLVDSRSEVFDYFIKDFDFWDWLLGRGVDGTYFHPIRYWNFTNEESREVVNRENIENGYLFLVLKGGLVYLIMVVGLALYAIFKGLCFSNNSIIKGFSIYILTYLIEMFSFGQPSFSFKYFLFWFAIGVCLSKKFRRMNC